MQIRFGKIWAGVCVAGESAGRGGLLPSGRGYEKESRSPGAIFAQSFRTIFFLFWEKVHVGLVLIRPTFRRIKTLFRDFFGKREFVSLASVNQDMVTLQKISFQNFQGQRIFNITLDRPFQWPGAK